jgi:hypothetical protein
MKANRHDSVVDDVITAVLRAHAPPALPQLPVCMVAHTRDGWVNDPECMYARMRVRSGRGFRRP